MEVMPRTADPAPAGGALAFLFTDLEGSTRLWERSPAAMAGALARHDTILRDAVEAAGGTVVKSTGDGTMAVFGSAADGVRASLAAQVALDAAEWPDTGPLRVRMALHAGEVDRRADDYFGPTVNRTARIMGAAHGGQIVLSSVAAGLAADRLPEGASLLDLGEYRLKDLGRPERLFQLVHPAIRSTFPPLLSHTDEAIALPGGEVDFVGRTAELSDVDALLADPTVRLVTLLGPGGTGKTTLAQRVAAGQVGRFADGVRFVDLAPVGDTESALVAIARAIGLPETIERPLADELVDFLRDRHILLVLDNFEQVTEAAGAVGHLLADCPRLVVLVTSREVLRLRAERVYPVAPLDLPPEGERHPAAAELVRFEAIELFVRRARAVRPDFNLTDDNAAAVVEVCRRLDGLPLAIELAAARLRLFSPEALRDRLTGSLDLLRGGSRDLPARQQTLRSTIDWSYQLLDPGEQRLFELLAAFAGSDLSAIEAVAEAVRSASDGQQADRLDVLDGLPSLIEKSLVRQVETGGTEPRFTMLETIREFAAEALDRDPERAAVVRQAHADHFAAFATEQRRELAGSRPEQALATLALEAGNLRLAWRRFRATARFEGLIEIADALLILNEARGWYLDTVALGDDLLDAIEASPRTPDLVAQEVSLRMSLARAMLATRGYTPEVEAAYRAALDLFEAGGSNHQHYSVLRGLANLYLLRAEFGQGIDLGRRILALAEQEDDPAMRINGHLVLGSTLAFTGDLAAGTRHLEIAISEFGPDPGRSRGHLTGNDPRVACLTTSGFMLWLGGRPDAAVARMDRAIELSAALAHPFTSAYARFHAALLHLWRLEPSIVRERARSVLEIADEYDFRIWHAAGTCLLGAADVALDRADEGLAAIERGMGRYGTLRTPPVFWPMLLSIKSGANLIAGRLDDALGAVDEAIAIVSGGTGVALLPEFWLLKGDVTAAREAAAGYGAGEGSAEAWYRRAYDEAAALEEVMPRLKAATRLATLDAAAGRGPEGVARLRSVLDLVTEGGDTFDVRAARAVLEGP